MVWLNQERLYTFTKFDGMRESKLISSIFALVLIFSFSACALNDLNESDHVKNTSMDNIETQLNALCEMTPESYDAHLVVMVVNQLLAKGKEETLEMISQAYHRRDAGNSDGYGLFVALRLVFEIPTGEKHPEIRFGKPDIESPTSGAERFPILLVDDIPLQVIRGYFMTGLPQHLDEHLSFYHEHGTLRTTVINNTISGSEEEFYNQFETTWSTSTLTAPSEELKKIIQEQISSLARN